MRVKEVFSECSSAFKELHMQGPDKAPQAAETVRKAHRRLRNYASMIIEDNLAEDVLDVLRSCLVEMHPEKEYANPLAIARDIIDIAITLGAMTEISGTEYTRIRRDHTKISDAVMFFIDLEKVEQ